MKARTIAAAWFWLFVLLPLLRHHGSKPRLQPIAVQLDMLLSASRKCRETTRFSPAELRALAADLHIEWNANVSGNWRYADRHRLVLFLLSFSNAWPSRKLQLAAGWAANAVLNNWRWHIAHIIECLDVPEGG
jgi:hypothetical protein